MAEHTAEQIRENIYRLGVTLPENPLRELNSYLIRGKERDLLIDTGFRRPECREALMNGIAEAGSSTDRLDVLLTHLHSDHTGLAREAASPDGRIYISETDFKVLQEGFLPQRSLLRHRQFLEAGFPEELLKKTEAVNPASRYKLDALDGRFCPLREGDKIPAGPYNLTMISVPGHTPGNAMFWEEEHRIMFTGDHILFDISPNITSWLGVEDSLGDYLDSLRKAKQYPVELALPGHRKTGNYGERIEALLLHHEKRLQEVINLLIEKPDMTLYELTGKMRWKIRAASWEDFPAAQKWFAVGECMAHVDYLEKLGKVCHRLEDGVRRYRAEV